MNIKNQTTRYEQDGIHLVHQTGDLKPGASQFSVHGPGTRTQEWHADSIQELEKLHAAISELIRITKKSEYAVGPNGPYVRDHEGAGTRGS